MNISNLGHAGLALAFQLIAAGIAWFCGVPMQYGLVIGAMLGIGFYFGREVAQSERKLGTPPWWIGFDMTKWSKDAVFDFVCPLIACVLVCVISSFVF